jgi:hypothetical protein
MNVLHRPTFTTRKPPANDPFAPPEARALAEAEAPERAVAVEPPAAPAASPPEEPLVILERHVKRILAEERRQSEAKRNHLDRVAALVRSLTYAEMIELAEGFWKQKSEGEISQEMLPGMLHKWSESR